MNIQVNGKSMTMSDRISVHQLLENLKLQERRVVVELNTEIVDKQGFKSTMIHDKDTLEIIQFVPGG